MDAEREALRARISRVIGWEQRKRREATLAVALFYAFLAALAAPLFVSVSHGLTWATPAAFFVLLTPFMLYVRRWRDQDTARAVAALDRRLNLDERATTAWELLHRNETRAVGELVLRQASDRVKDVDARKLFPRSWGWRTWSLVPLVALWLGLTLFEAHFQQSGAGQGEAPALARETRELARRLQEKAQSEGLPQTLEAGRELEKIARRGVEAKTADSEFRNELAGVAGKMAAERRASRQAPFGGPESVQQLADLRAELEAARELLGAAGAEGGSWEDRLSALSELKKQLERQEGARSMSRDEMQAFLDKLDRRVAAELDRRALLDAERAVRQLAQRGPGKEGDAKGAGAGKERGLKEVPGEIAFEEGAAAAPGSKPGQDTGRAPPTELRSAEGSQVKGTITEGPRSGIFFRAKPAAGKSALSQEEVVASYRRQAEAELNTENIPGELKDAIRNYFLLLEKAK